MKKFLLVASLIFLLIAAVIAFFITTFNINNYKGAFISQLEAITGNAVDIGELALSWQGELVIDVRKFRIYDRKTNDTLFPFQAASAGVQLLPLLRRHVEISSISLVSPLLNIVRAKDGKIEIKGYTPPEKKDTGVKTPVAAKTSGAGPALQLNISSIDIQQGTLRFQDMMSDPPPDLTVRNLDATVKNISLNTPMVFSAKMALASTEQNMAFSGTAGGFAAGQPFLKDFEGRFELSKIGYDDLIKAIPQLRALGVRDRPNGIFTVKLHSLEFANNKMSKLRADASLTDGHLALAQLKAPLNNVTFTISVDDDVITVKSFSGELASAVMSGSGRVDGVFSSPKTSLQTKMEIRGIKSFLASVAGSDQPLDGNLKVMFEGVATGSDWAEIHRTLAGKGSLTLEKGVILENNLVRQTLGALSLFPSLAAVSQGAPAGSGILGRSISERYTILRPFSQPFVVEGGYIILPETYIATDFLDFRGTAKVSFAGDLSGNGIIRFSPDISNEMTAIVPQMRYLSDSQGLVQFPMAFKGGAEGFKVIPDAKYIAQKIAIQETGRIVTDLLAPSGVNKEQTQQAAQPAGEAKPPKIKDVLKNLLKE
ncbi:MAG: AsmA family protein [Candidatus Omnitrophica bacterium]|nr:AsmA family protein [Candidatus Omnitrophota bacterium]